MNVQLRPETQANVASEVGVTDKKRLGETVLGWFVVREGEGSSGPADKAAPADARQPEPPPGDDHDRLTPTSRSPSGALQALRLQGDVPNVVAGATPDAQVFAQVFTAAQIAPEAQQRVDKAVSLLNSLPTETPRDVRKQIVEASLKAFGIPVDEIIEAAAEEIQALEAHIQRGARHTQSVLDDAGQQIAKLEDQVAEIKKLRDLQLRTQQTLVRASNEQKLRVQAVLEFFGQDAVLRVVKRSPKLVDPRGGKA